jgi:hypothetical protein
VDPDLAVEAVAAARKSGDPVLLAGVLDTVVIAAGRTGRLREAKGYAEERLGLVEPLPRHEPYPAAAEDPATGHPYVTLPRRIRIYALLGRFDEAVARADLLWERWHRAGEPPMEWMASAFAVAGAVHGLLRAGDFALWQQRARRSADADGPTLAASAAFAEALVAIHTGPDDSARRLVSHAFAPFAETWWEPYARGRC